MVWFPVFLVSKIAAEIHIMKGNNVASPKTHAHTFFNPTFNPYQIVKTIIPIFPIIVKKDAKSWDKVIFPLTIPNCINIDDKTKIKYQVM